MRAVYTVTVHRYAPGAPNAHGNVAPTFVDEDALVYAVGPKHSPENNDGTRDETHTLREVYVPAGFTCTPLDEITVEGERWQVYGLTADYTTGPFRFHPGGVVTIRRQEG